MTTTNGNLAMTEKMDDKTLLSVISNGDCSALTAEQKTMYYKARCEAAGLDPRAQPFQFIKLQGKEVLYALKACTDQLASKNGLRVEILSQIVDAGILTVTVRAIAKDGRATDEIGCVSLGNLTGDALCNARMKGVTKAKRRAVLSISGLGMLDETELEMIPNANAPANLPMPQRKSTPKAEIEHIKAQTEQIKNVTAEVKQITAEPIVIVPDEAQAPQQSNGAGEYVQVLDVTSKKIATGTSYGIKCELADKPGESFFVNTFSDTDASVASDCKSKNEAVEIVRKPREYKGKTYWDLVSIAPVPF